jgi:hypothetical protein
MMATLPMIESGTSLAPAPRCCCLGGCSVSKAALAETRAASNCAQTGSASCLAFFRPPACCWLGWSMVAPLLLLVMGGLALPAAAGATGCPGLSRLNVCKVVRAQSSHRQARLATSPSYVVPAVSLVSASRPALAALRTVSNPIHLCLQLLPCGLSGKIVRGSCNCYT